jgi:pimeloyl-ACP methyl ester carboxylesterase
MAFEKIAGVQLSIECAGSGAQCLIFVHGGFCDRHDWDAQVHALASRFRLITFDLPGHGQSALPAQADLAALGQTLCELNTRYGGGQAILVGHSLGVDVILECFRQSPAGIAGMVLIEGVLLAEGDADQTINAFKAHWQAVGVNEFLHAAIEGMFLPGSDPQLRERALKRLENLDLQFAQEIVLSKIRWDANQVRQVLAAVNVPVLLLQGALEPGMTTPWTELATRQLRDAELCVTPAAGHFPQIEAADLVSRRIGEFAERLRESAKR